MYKLRICWGEDQNTENEKTYNFNTKNELLSFMKGVNEACGWHDYLLLEDTSDTFLEDDYDYDEDDYQKHNERLREYERSQ
tara:strand:+ start:109 stop:351 length:243 start_codon:yes stop_codon:yes gene_type:complete